MNNKIETTDRRYTRITPVIERRDADPIAQRRRDNLRIWMANNKVTSTGLASRLEVGRAYVSNLNRIDRSFGERAARHIEQKLAMPEGYLDGSSIPGEATENWEKPADIVEDMYGLVPRVDLVPSPSGLQREERQLPPIALPKSWLVAQKIESPDDIVFLLATDDSMLPYIRRHDLVMLDMAQVEIKDGEVYAVQFGGGQIRLRRLNQGFDGGLILQADNSIFPQEALRPEQVAQAQILGRVLWRAG